MFYWLVKYTLRPVFRLLFRPVVIGEQHIPASGGALLASNHLSMCDSLFLPVMTQRRVTFLAKNEYFTGRGLKGRAKAAFVRGTGLIPLDRGNTDAAAAALATGAHCVATGRLLGVYPEGTRSPDGRLYRGKTGAARIALPPAFPSSRSRCSAPTGCNPSAVASRNWPECRSASVPRFSHRPTSPARPGSKRES
ncbi:MAG: 1-acyl-sn-glycerol-3-phosphate acyltransferase [Frankiaceae bacterium]|nr:1-acyl-sn-glycerol-3-phosphate acyltransferase [Frankiaceae bacterium]